MLFIIWRHVQSDCAKKNLCLCISWLISGADSVSGCINHCLRASEGVLVSRPNMLCTRTSSWKWYLSSHLATHWHWFFNVLCRIEVKFWSPFVLCSLFLNDWWRRQSPFIWKCICLKITNSESILWPGELCLNKSSVCILIICRHSCHSRQFSRVSSLNLSFPVKMDVRIIILLFYLIYVHAR